jgi:Arc/MetJ-type ribon-helix-helix transcriptional regulator
MKIVKCSCSRSIHVFSQANKKTCLFCGSPVDDSGAIGSSFREPFSFIGVKLEEIDWLIGSGSFGDAKTKINEVLEIIPRPSICDLPNTGEIYWRKLLAEIGCKNDFELLVKGTSLDKYSAFNNALDYAAANEKPVYIAINEKKESILVELKNVLRKQELNEKSKIGSEQILGEYQKELDTQKKHAQEKILELEDVEKAIHEQIIDYMTTIGEYKNSIDAIRFSTELMENKKDDITLEEKKSWLKQLEFNLSRSNQEISKLMEQKTNNRHYLEYSRLAEKQKAIVSDINGTISQIYGNLKSKINGSLVAIKQINNQYTNAVSDLESGNYEPVRKLISQSCFDEIVGQVMASNQSQRSIL